jgi:hypothetical protein
MFPHFVLITETESAAPRWPGELLVVQEPPLSHNVALLSVTIFSEEESS